MGWLPLKRKGRIFLPLPTGFLLNVMLRHLSLIQSGRREGISRHHMNLDKVRTGTKPKMLPTYRHGKLRKDWRKFPGNADRKILQGPERRNVRMWHWHTSLTVCTLWYQWGMMLLLGYGTSACPRIVVWLQGQIPGWRYFVSTLPFPCLIWTGSDGYTIPCPYPDRFYPDMFSKVQGSEW